MNTPHKYVKEITYWANGGEIQVKYYSDEFPEFIDYSLEEMPDFNDPNCEWRIKPKPVTLRYRVALMLKHDSPVNVYQLRMVTTDEQEMFIKDSRSYGRFDKWLTDWIELVV